MKMTVTSVQPDRRAGKTGSIVYSRNELRDRVKTPLELFDKVCLEVVSTPEVAQRDSGPKLTQSQCAKLFDEAHRAGMQAGEACTPVPMTVVEHANPLDDNSPVIRQYAPEPQGVCGFANVLVRPGNSPFANYLKKSRGARKGYYGGTSFSVRPFGQSYERKCAYARAFCEVLGGAGITAYVDSRLD